jgi:DNA-binding MarR family transcriptional regulator
VSEPQKADVEALADVYLVLGPLYRRVLRAVEDDRPNSGVTAGERAVLDMLRRQGVMTVPEMAREQDLSRQFVQRMVNSAADSGYVEAVENPAHRRSPLLRLTAAGRGAIEALVDRENESLRAAAEGLTRGDVDACLKVLHQMLAVLKPSDV